MSKIFYVRIIGTAISESFKAVSHEVKAYPSNTYHVFGMTNGSMLWFNDFGIRSILFADTPEGLHA